MTNPVSDAWNGSTSLWYGTSGPPDANIVIVGESWGVEEDNAKKPFIGTSGTELNRMLAEAGLDRNHVLCTNIVASRPQHNETWRLFRPKAVGGSAIRGLLPSDLIVDDVRRLYAQIAAAPRTLVIGTGNYALWALSDCTRTTILRESNGRKIPPDLQTYVPAGIMDWRGSMNYIEPHRHFTADEDQYFRLKYTKLLPIIHPAAIMREWYLRSPTVHDLKTRVRLAINDDWRPNPEPEILAPPTFDQAIARFKHWLARADTGEVILLANDIETLRRRFISVIGFADSTSFAMCIPFIRSQLPDGSFESWWTPRQEGELLYYIRLVLSHPNIRLMGQNYIYDIQYIQNEMGITPHLDHDTMLAQNVIFPGTPKDLNYLSSLYCHYHWYWKDDVKDWNNLGDVDVLMNYNCVDNLRTWEIGWNQAKYINHIKQSDQFRMKMNVHHLCLRMMNRGVLLDQKRRGQLSFELHEALASIEHELLGIIPQDMVKPIKKKTDKMWYRSAKQTAELFYDVLGFRTVTNRKTGNRTVGKEAIPQLKRWYPEFTGLFDRLDTYGSADNTLDVLGTVIEHDGRMRCSYNPGGTETHRLSSSKNVFGRGTNLQNLTKGEEDE